MQPGSIFHINRRATLLAAAVFATGLYGAAIPAAAQKSLPLKVAAIYTVPLEQQWVSRVHQALNAASERGDIVYVHASNIANNNYEQVLRHYAEQDMDLIVGEVFGVEQVARLVAADYPDTAFLMGSSSGPVAPNFAVFDNFIHEPSYLTGMIAGGVTRSNVIGMVGGYAIPEVNRLMHAFMAGALSVNPELSFLVTFIDSWDAPLQARDAAFAQIDQGADILYAERFGVADAARERGIKAIGNVIDTAADYPGTILASALWHMEPTIDLAIAAVAAANFTPIDYGQYSYMAHGGASYVIDQIQIPTAVVAAVRAKEQEIRAGLFHVAIDDTKPQPTLFMTIP